MISILHFLMLPGNMIVKITYQPPYQLYDAILHRQI